MFDTAAESAVRAAAVAYCEGLHNSTAETFEALCHDRFFMTSVQPDGSTLFIDKPTFVERVRARQPFAGTPSFEILAIDVEPEIAHVKLWVDMPPRRFCDYLGFFRIDGEWKLVTKLFRTASGPAVGH